MARRVAQESPTVAAFDLLAQYDLQEEIGAGDRARVYRARDRVLDHVVAVKLLRDRHGRDSSLAAHLYLTARAAAGLGHPNIVAVYDHGPHDGSAFITSELIEGQSLADLLSRGGPLPVRQALPIAARVLDALSAAHTHGIAHGDLHPRNVLLRAGSADGVVLTDFGMSLAREHSDSFAPYRAPEELAGEPASIAGDLYAVGVILHELLTGERPPAEGLKRRPATIPRPLFATLGQALAVAPGDRYPSAAAFREELTLTGGAALPAVWVAAQEGPLEAAVRVAEAPAPTRAAGRRGPYRTAAVLVAGTIALGGLAGAAALATTTRTTPTPTVAVTEEPVEQPVTEPVEQPVEETSPAPEPTASVAAVASAAPTTVAVPTAQPTAPPTPTVSAQAAALAPSVNTPPVRLAQAPTPTVGPRPTPTIGTPRVVANNGVGGAVGISLENFSPYLLQGAYQPSDVRSRDNAQVAIYGAGSGYNVGILTFEATILPSGQSTLVLTGLDDERETRSTIQIILNGYTLFSGASGFANRPPAAASDPAAGLPWDQMILLVPAGTLQSGPNTLVIRNISTGAELAPPYILINNLEFASEAP